MQVFLFLSNASLFFTQDHVYELLNTIDACQCFFDIVSFYCGGCDSLKSAKALKSYPTSADNPTRSHSHTLFILLLCRLLLPAPSYRLCFLSPTLLLFSLSVFFIIIITTSCLVHYVYPAVYFSKLCLLWYDLCSSCGYFKHFMGTQTCCLDLFEEHLSAPLWMNSYYCSRNPFCIFLWHKRTSDVIPF